MSPLSRPSRFRRLGLCVAAGTLAALTAGAPAALAADPQPAGQRAEATAPDPTSDELSASALQREHEARQEAQGQGQAEPQRPKRTYKGRVIAKPYLLLRDKPTRSSRIVGSVEHGAVVHIFCKTKGDNVDGNNRWYLLTDGTWAWGSARYIENIGAAPRWC
ncbi:SH3 domain-containing protein [Streptomyces sp. C11-1]|uniref:SH3 domain-containing protein n=1 Tax=Streptomyces durocortorensis TaxID=2811104 RepID=A0ABY9W275_9ACTN|nr:SH3 domain-containing protein [Streptomyces durocortorensis]WNF29564.1 SH3 domain-containing protein [Streptomyces durocortorensis]